MTILTEAGICYSPGPAPSIQSITSDIDSGNRRSKPPDWVAETDPAELRAARMRALVKRDFTIRSRDHRKKK
jgi:hypothetical protein